MGVQHIHAFLVHPGKGGRDKIEINGTTVPLAGSIVNLLDSIYSRSDQECKIDISFRPSPDGKQQNDCRDLLIGYVSDPTLDSAKLVAERLRDTTDGRSGLGLLFLIVGKESANHKIVISRFPTDSAIYVDEKARSLTVEFLERVFMKNKASYKAVVYQDTSMRGGFWTGRWPDMANIGYWPPNIPREETVTAFIAAYAIQGYAQCADGALEAGFEKIVLYGVRVALEIVPTHAARQLSDGRWTSKLGNCEDIEHDTPEMLNGPRYGAPVCFLKRQR